MLSIVIPVYNAENYIGQCIERILQQKNPHWELLLINDGSKDLSKEIIDDYATKDERIKIFSQENKGPAAARNLGIKYATGQFLAFVDADDLVSIDYVDVLLAEMTEDLLFFNAQLTTKDKHVYKLPMILQSKDIQQDIGAMLIKQKSGFDFVFPWNKCFRKSIIDEYSIFFPEDISHSEDEIFTLRYLLQINSFKTIDKVLYYYNDYGASAQRTIGVLEFMRICDYLYELSNLFINHNIRMFLKNRWIYFSYRAFYYNPNDLNTFWRNLRNRITSYDISLLKETYYIYHNNQNFFFKKRWYVPYFKAVLHLKKGSFVVLFLQYLIYLSYLLHAALYKIRYRRKFMFSE